MSLCFGFSAVLYRMYYIYISKPTIYNGDSITNKIKIILGSIRQGRFGERPATWLYEQLKNWENIDVEILDLKDYPLPLFDSAVSPSRLNRKYPDEAVQKWADKLNDGDAFIIVTPEYNHGYPGALKNALDWTYPEWTRKPVGFVGYGSASGARAVEQLRDVFIELKAVPVYKSLHIGWDVIAKTFGNMQVSNTDLFAYLRDGSIGMDHVAAFVDDLLWYARVLKAERDRKV